MTDWRDAAACKGRPLSLWFPGPYDELSARIAVAVCKGCPSRVPCLEEALDEEVGAELPPSGIRGARTGAERAVMLKAMRARQPVAEPMVSPVPVSTGRRTWPHRPYVAAL